MRLFSVRTETVQIGQDITKLILESLKAQNLELENDDILVLTSKIVAYSEGRIIKLDDLKPSEKAKKLARSFSLKPEFAELILREADEIYGGAKKAMLTLKRGVLTANSGV
ncbi:MAG: coenzyme F420-0:L-glutamate ligase, partial [Candidatus Bathyarchaeota archaeon]